MELELLKDIDMLLMVKNNIKGGMCQAIHHHAKFSSKLMKGYDSNKESSYLCTGRLTTCMDARCHKNYPWIASNGEKTCLGLMKNS